MRIGGAWLNQTGTQALCAALGLAGHRILFVGGCVRNALLQEPVTDLDLATDALPQDVTQIATGAGFKVVPTGIDHGTVTVIAGGIVHEITTFRRDVATDGRRAVVAYSSDLAEDAARRDFTINALYAEPTGEVVDPLDGLPDLIARRIRFVGQPEQRIREDYLRILRFFRFHAVYGDPALGIDPDGLAACAALAEGIDGLSRERIGAEMRKLFAARDPGPALASMAASGVLARVLPGSDVRGIPRLVHLEGGLAPRWQRRLVVVGGQDAGQRLRLSRQEQSEIALIRDEIGSPLRPAGLGWRLGLAPATDVILARAALLGQSMPPSWQADLARGAQSRFPVSAADLMPGFRGAQLGARLKELEDRWLASDLKLTREDLLA
ncbi:CCA tRNA nucleotidyltransferase [bacterium]|nr:CCA tRNA nucleotidyltransferase [bacterium]